MDIESRLLTGKECGDIEHKEGEHLQWCRPILKAQDTKSVKARDKEIAGMMFPLLKEGRDDELWGLYEALKRGID